MQITLTRPILLGTKVMPEGTELEAEDQHARELIARGYAQAIEPEPVKPTKATKVKAQ